MRELKAGGAAGAVFLNQLADTLMGLGRSLGRGGDVLLSLGFWLQEIMQKGGSESEATSFLVVDEVVVCSGGAG